MMVATNTNEEERYLNYLATAQNLNEVDSDKKLAENDNYHMIKHNEVYTELLDCYVGNISKTLAAKYWFKIFFFITVMASMVLILGVFIEAVEYAFTCEDVAIAIAAIVGAFVSFISATIAIPSVIAKYLFNFNEEKDALEIIKRMQEFDKTLRKKD